jgi:nucleoside-diphosphate-sugar epimerase
MFQVCSRPIRATGRCPPTKITGFACPGLAMAENAFNLLITGAGSGLGFAVHQQLGGVAFARGMALDDSRICAAQPFDAIVHCALRVMSPVTTRTCYTYLEDNFLLTEQLLDIPHHKFIYVSTLDVYPRLGRAIGEDEDVDLSTLAGPYSFVKLFSDILVQNRAPNHLVLRTTTQLGTSMRKTTVTWRLLTERGCRLGLSEQSQYNYILQDDVVAFIREALQSDRTGVYNLGSRANVRLADMARELGLVPAFGDELYDVGPVDAKKAASVMSAFARDSRQNVNLFIDALGNQFVGSGSLSST